MRPTVVRFCCVVFLALLWLAGTPVVAFEVPELNTAPVVVVGKVRKVWVDDSTAAKGYVLHLIEIDVEKVEKAEKVGSEEGPKPGKVLYVGTPYFQDVPGVRAPAGDLPRVKPAAGATVRMYFTVQEDGRYAVLMNAVAIKVLAEPKKG